MPGFWENDRVVDQPPARGRGFWENDPVVAEGGPAAFDAAEYARFKNGRGAQAGANGPQTFSPAEYEAFKAKAGQQTKREPNYFDRFDPPAGDVRALSDAELLAAIRGGAPGAPKPPGVEGLSDAELLGALRNGGRLPQRPPAGNYFDRFDEPVPGASSDTTASGQDRATAALQPFFDRGVRTRNSAGQWTPEARARLAKEGIDPLGVDQKQERALLDAYQAKTGQQTGSDAAAIGRGLINGVPVVGPALLSGTNKTAAFLRSISFGIPYDQALKEVEGFGERTANANPEATTAGELAGGVVGTAPLVAAAPAAFGAGAAALPVRALTSAMTGGALSGADAAARGGDIADAVKGGAAFGAAAPVAGAAIGKVVGGVASRLRPVDVPTTADIKSMASAAYKRADDAGVQISADAYERGFQELTDAVRKAGFNAKLYPKSAAVLEELERNVGTAPTLRDVELLRRVAGGAAGSSEAAERRIGNLIIDKLDDFTGKLKPADVVAGDADAAVASLNEARDLWARYSRSRTLETGMDRAERGAQAASGGASADKTNATRQTIRRILDDPRKAAAYSADEIAEMEAVVRGGPAQRALRLIGRLSPQNGGLQALGSAVAAIHDPKLAALPIAGTAAKFVADRNTNAAIQRLSQNVRNGSAVPANPTAIAAGEGAEDLARYLLAPVPAYATR